MVLMPDTTSATPHDLPTLPSPGGHGSPATPTSTPSSGCDAWTSSRTGSTHVDPAGIESEVAGWRRGRGASSSPSGRRRPRAWVTVHDRAAGRATVWGYFDRDVPEVDAIADAFYRWAERTAVAMARLRGVTATRLDESPFADDTRQAQWLTRAGYARRRSWLHMTRPVVPDEAALAPRAGVTVRPVERHENGMPVATDLQVVHQMLETSFQDHFNSYRESFSSSCSGSARTRATAGTTGGSRTWRPTTAAACPRAPWCARRSPPARAAHGAPTSSTSA